MDLQYLFGSSDIVGNSLLISGIVCLSVVILASLWFCALKKFSTGGYSDGMSKHSAIIFRNVKGVSSQSLESAGNVPTNTPRIQIPRLLSYDGRMSVQTIPVRPISYSRGKRSLSQPLQKRMRGNITPEQGRSTEEEKLITAVRQAKLESKNTAFDVMFDDDDDKGKTKKAQKRKEELKKKFEEKMKKIKADKEEKKREREETRKKKKVENEEKPKQKTNKRKQKPAEKSAKKTK